jgi:hypothetical protein
VADTAAAVTVCLILEGSYPFVTGGVSAWVQELILGLPDVRFALHTISPKQGQTVRYTLPPNIVAHSDVVISEHPRSRAKPRGGAGALVGPIRDLHASLAAGSVPDLAPLFARMPPGYFPSEDALKSDTLWNMLIAANQRHNPVYAFSDYFWSWWSSHAMAFQTIGTALPEATRAWPGWRRSSARAGRCCSRSTGCTTRSAPWRSSARSSCAATSATCGSPCSTT